MYNMRNAGKCINIGYGIGATDKVLSDGKRSFLLEMLGQVIKN